MKDQSQQFVPGDQVLIEINPHEADKIGILGTVERIDKGTGFQGCDLVYVNYQSDNPDWLPLPFALVCLSAANPERLWARAKELEHEAGELRRLARLAVAAQTMEEE